jgi:hypothetical protein
MKRKSTLALNTLVCGALLALSGCGGGGGGESASSNGTNGGTSPSAPANPSTPTPVPVAVGGTTDIGVCNALDYSLKPGNTVKVAYQNSTSLNPAIIRNWVQESVSLTDVPFGNQIVMRSETKTTEVNAPGGGTDTTINVGHFKRTGAGQLTVYQTQDTNTSTVPGAGTRTSTFSYNPPFVDNMNALSVGETTEKRTEGMLVFQPPLPGMPITTFDVTTRIKLAAIETITVPAGTFETCRYEISTKEQPASTGTHWYLKGKGTFVKSVSNTVLENNQLVVNTTVATSIELNGTKP